MEFYYDVITKMSDNEILKLISETVEKKKSFQVIPIEVPEEIALSEDTVIGDLGEYYRFGEENFKKSIFGIPYYDQREDPFYHTEILGLGKILIPPDTNGFVYIGIDGKPVEEPLGLVQLTIHIADTVRNDNVMKWTRTIAKKSTEKGKEYKEVKHFYFDYAKGIYVQVNLKNLNNENTMEYISRVTINKFLKQRMMEILKKFFINFLETSQYNKLILDVARGTNNSLNGYKAYFEGYGFFLEEAEKHLAIMIVMGKLDKEEYAALKIYIEELHIKVVEMLGEISNLKREHKVQNIDYGGVNGELTSFFEKELGVLNDECIAFVLPMDEKEISTQGYIRITNQKVFPNFVHAYRRYFLMTEPISKQKLLDREKVLMERHQI